MSENDLKLAKPEQSSRRKHGDVRQRLIWGEAEAMVSSVGDHKDAALKEENSIALQ